MKYEGSTRRAAWLLVMGLAASGCREGPAAAETPKASAPAADELPKTEEGWKKRLTPKQYRVLRGQGTEPAWSGAYWKTKTQGTYLCAGCGQALFSSRTKYDSRTGWPSFYQPLSETAVRTKRDTRLGMTRTEVHCRRCGGHLGHVFNDGPKPTGLRYCINSVSLTLKPEK